MGGNLPDVAVTDVAPGRAAGSPVSQYGCRAVMDVAATPSRTIDGSHGTR